jgi:hypothetical protein
MTSFTVTRQTHDYQGRSYEVTIDDGAITWKRDLWEEDLDELADRVQQALDGRTPEPMHDWRSDKYPDENLADREAPTFNLTPDPEHRGGWRLAITEYAQVTIGLRGLDLAELSEAIEKASQQ